MKGRYAGGRMTTYGYVLPGAALVARSALKAGNLSKRARMKLKVLDWHQKHGKNISLTARRFGMQRLTLRTWIRKLRQCGPVGLNDISHRPKRMRQPGTPWDVVMKIAALRNQYPAWSKYKIQIILEREGIKVSASTIGRILKRRGFIHHRTSAKRRKAALHPKARFPRGLRISRPGDMVQMDTKYVVTSNRTLFQFTAIDVLTKVRVLRIFSSQASRNGAFFLNTCLKEFPFPIQAVQTDNGGVFLKEFERLCRNKKLTHYFIYPHSPKQNSYVERSHGADEKEFYQQGNTYQEETILQKRILEWQRVWNEVRPHEALDYLTPMAYLKKWQTSRLPTNSIITLQT